jgi:fructose-bisphosphate aldolase class I
MHASSLASTVLGLLAPGKGILAADESFPTLGRRFEAHGIPSTPESRQAYRELLFSTPQLGDWISGVILFDETIRQQNSSGVPFATALARSGMVPGIKVDKGVLPLANFEGETITGGLDGLRERLVEYRALGARFAKWRAVTPIGPNLPTRQAMRFNARSLAQYAALCQETGLVPIVEPEVLMDGTHSLARCGEVTQGLLETVFSALTEQRVCLEHVLLKVNMVIGGDSNSRTEDVEEIARATRQCLLRTVPAAVPGILFLSGGQSAEFATRRLAAICEASNLPWVISFSFGRALQESVMSAWKGKPENVPAAQAELLKRASANGRAILPESSVKSGRWTTSSSVEPPLVSTLPKEPMSRLAGGQPLELGGILLQAGTFGSIHSRAEAHRFQSELLRIHPPEEIQRMHQYVRSKLPPGTRPGGTATRELEGEFRRAADQLDDERYRQSGFGDVVKGLLLWVETAEERADENRLIKTLET